MERMRLSRVPQVLWIDIGKHPGNGSDVMDDLIGSQDSVVPSLQDQWRSTDHFTVCLLLAPRPLLSWLTIAQSVVLSRRAPVTHRPSWKEVCIYYC
jgi:hypothetical protein